MGGLISLRPFTPLAQECICFAQKQGVVAASADLAPSLGMRKAVDTCHHSLFVFKKHGAKAREDSARRALAESAGAPCFLKGPFFPDL